MRLTWISALVILALALSMCGPDSSVGGEGDDDDGSSSGGASRGGTAGDGAGAPDRGGSSSGTNGEAGAAGDDGTSGGNGGTSGASGGSSGASGSGGCEERPADVLILLDRSASMQDPPDLPGDPGATPRWDLAIPPLLEALSTTTAPIRWGLKTLPEGGELDPACAAGSVTAAIDVPIADDNVEPVREAILATTPHGASTPTGDAVKQAAAYLQGFDPENPKFILLLTDGEPSCINVTPTMAGSEGQEAARPYAVQALTDTLDAAIPTFVLGVGTNGELARNTLDEMALAGGRPAPEVNPLASVFYLANDPSGVTSALGAIVASASSCGAPPFPSLELPYADDFETSGAADWRFISVPWAVANDAGSNVLQLSSTGDSETTWAIGGDRNWTDLRVEMRVKFVSGEGMILLSPRWKDLDNRLFVEYEAEDKPKLRQRSQGSTADIITAEDTLTFALGQWHTVAVTLQGTTATLEFDGTVIGSGTISALSPRGGIGIAVENGIVAIDDVRVTAP